MKKYCERLSWGLANALQACLVHGLDGAAAQAKAAL